jgi:hypothetical protein
MVRAEQNDTVSESFEAHVAPVRDSIVNLLDVTDRLAERWGGLPAANSMAMAEFAEESKYVGGGAWGDEPVRGAHFQAGLLLFAAADCARGVCRLLNGTPTPIYSHLVLVRPTVEHAARAWRILEPGIGVKRRIARGVNERIFSLQQQDSLPLAAGEQRRARERRRTLSMKGNGSDS